MEALFAVLAVAFGTTLALEEGVCSKPGVEREEIKEELEPMWTIRPFFNCSTENIDAATMTPDKKTYFFKGDYYWRLIDDHVAPGYPRLIQQDWGRLPGNLDAALTWKDGRTFFFKGHEYWSFHGKDIDVGYPRNISDGFCGIPDNIDGAFLWKNNNQAYFFKGDQYWRFDGGEACKPVSDGFPKSINKWEDVPADIDDVLQWENGRTYFLKGSDYYRFNDDGKDTEAGRPVKIHHNWGLKCSELKCRIPIATLSDDVDIRKLSSSPDPLLQ